MTIKQLRNTFIEFGGIMTTRELNTLGINYYFIRKQLHDGKIKRVKQGVYRWEGDRRDDWVEVSKMVPQGVFCLFSAAQLHELSTFIPSEYQVAIPRKDKVRLPEYPIVKLYYWHPIHHKTGISSITSNGVRVKVYDLEKTVCDFIKYRNKVGLDATKEVIKNYLKRKDRNLNKLMEYSKRLRLSSVVHQYLDLLV